MDNQVVFDAKKKKKGKKGGATSQTNQIPQDLPQLSQREKQLAEKIGKEAGVIRATRENVESERTDQKKRGKQEGVKEEAEEKEQKKEQSNAKFEGLLNKTGQILMQFQTSFPFDLFPDRVTIDMNKVTISKREFFSSEIVTSIPAKEIKDISVSTAGFLATLTILTQSSPDPIVIEKIKKQDALRARRVLQALIMTEKENIQLTKVKTDNLVDKLETIGRVAQP